MTCIYLQRLYTIFRFQKMPCCGKTNVDTAKYLGVTLAFISGMGCLKYFEHEKAVGAGGLYRNDEYYPPGYKGIRLFNFIFYLHFCRFGFWNF